MFKEAYLRFVSVYSPQDDVISEAQEFLKKYQIYYSYLTAGGWIGSIDKLEYDKRYPEIVAECEKKYNCLVYHVIESGSFMSREGNAPVKNKSYQ